MEHIKHICGLDLIPANCTYIPANTVALNKILE